MSGVCACGAATYRNAVMCRNCKNRERAKAMIRPVPDDFLTVAPGKSVEALQAIYKTGPSVIGRWRKETGVMPGKAVPPVNPPRPVPNGFALAAPNLTMKQLRSHYGASEKVIKRWLEETRVQRRTVGRKHWRQPKPAVDVDYRENSQAGKAARHLQKFGPVVRCDANGRVNPQGTHWLRGGRTVLTDSELMDRARRNGWNPDAWMELAA